MAGIDLMAYAQGADLANRQNWQDQINSLNTQAAQRNLDQNQIQWDMRLPLAQMDMQSQLAALTGNRNAADLQTSVMSQLANLPKEQHGDVIANSVLNRLAKLDPTSPGAGHEMQALQTYLVNQASKYGRAGDMATAQKLLGVLPGAQVKAESLPGVNQQWIGQQIADAYSKAGVQNVFNPYTGVNTPIGHNPQTQPGAQPGAAPAADPLGALIQQIAQRQMPPVSTAPAAPAAAPVVMPSPAAYAPMPVPTIPVSPDYSGSMLSSAIMNAPSMQQPAPSNPLADLVNWLQGAGQPEKKSQWMTGGWR